MKTCSKCQETKPLTDFYVNSEGYVRGECKSCSLSRNKRWRQEQFDLYTKYKSSLSCERCGFDDARALQFHHHNDDKEDSVAELIRHRSFERVMEEISKCEVLCANCHSIEHNMGL